MASSTRGAAGLEPVQLELPPSRARWPGDARFTLTEVLTVLCRMRAIDQDFFQQWHTATRLIPIDVRTAYVVGKVPDLRVQHGDGPVDACVYTHAVLATSTTCGERWSKQQSMRMQLRTPADSLLAASKVVCKCHSRPQQALFSADQAAPSRTVHPSMWSANVGLFQIVGWVLNRCSAPPPPQAAGL